MTLFLRRSVIQIYGARVIEIGRTRKIEIPRKCLSICKTSKSVFNITI